MSNATELASELCIPYQADFYKVCEQAAQELLAQEQEVRRLAAHRDMLVGALDSLLEAVPPYRENGEPTIPDNTIAIVNDALRIAKETKE